MVIRSTNKFENIRIGTEFTLNTDEATYGDVYKQTTFEVVGIVSSPDFITWTDEKRLRSVRGRSAPLCTGIRRMCMICKRRKYISYLQNPLIGEENQAEVVCTDCWVKIAGADEYKRFHDDYKSYVLERQMSLKQ